MEILVEKLVGEKYFKKACAITSGKSSEKVKTTLAKGYDCEHSPIRTQIFWIELLEIPSFVSVHLVRHKIGVEHFVKSLRDDRGGKGNEGRDSLVNHAMLINAQALITMARKRLCSQAHKKTVAVMLKIREKIREVDNDLAEKMVRECEFRNGCHELRPCGYFNRIQNDS